MSSNPPVVISAVSTKGGVGKTTLIANLAGLMADLGYRVLMVDADVQPSLTKYYELEFENQAGIVELLLGENSVDNIQKCISSTKYQNLDIVISNNITAEIQIKVQNRHDRAYLLKQKFMQPFFAENYDLILIDTQGAVGTLQDTAAFASKVILSPIKPEVLSAREFMTGTNESLERLQQGRIMGLEVPLLRAIIYAHDRTRDSRLMSEEIKNHFKNLDGSRSLLETVVPMAKSYKESATLRMPVHCHEQTTTNKSESAYEIMHQLVYELFPMLKDQNIRASCFQDME